MAIDVTFVSDILLAFFLGEAPVIWFALQTPTSSPREVAGYVLIAAIGVVYLLVQGVNAFDPTGAGILAYLGASTLGIFVPTGIAKIATLLPHTGAGTTPPPT